MGEINVQDDYRTLLADGVVGYRGPVDHEDELGRWAKAIERLGEADDLRAGLMWCHADDVYWDPCVELMKSARRHSAHVVPGLHHAPRDAPQRAHV